MLFNKRRDDVIGNVSEKDVPLDERLRIISLLEDVLRKLTIARHHEDSITQRVVQLSLAEQCPLLKWIFIKDNEDNDNRMQEDIAISPQADPYNIFFLIEAKRLDSSLEKPREREYVIGRSSKKKDIDSEGIVSFKQKYIDSGGIERFKKEKHAKNFNNAAILGYVLTDDFNKWEKKINSWIDDEIIKSTSSILSWDDLDKLRNIDLSDKIVKFESSHSCISGKQISLTHIWINLTK